MKSWTLGAVALLTMACAPEPEEAAPPPSTKAPSEYGPDNPWYHAMENDVPAEEGDATFSPGKQVPNLIMFDQYGYDVALHQFAGRPIMLEIMTDGGRRVETEIEGACET